MFQSKPGALLSANWAASAATIAQTLGRAPSGNVPNVTINLIEPGSLYGDRINAVDMRFAKVLRFGKTRTNVGLDVYNLLNANTATTYETVYDPATNGARWMQPTAVLLPRFMRFNVQVDF